MAVRHVQDLKDACDRDKPLVVPDRERGTGGLVAARLAGVGVSCPDPVAALGRHGPLGGPHDVAGEEIIRPHTVVGIQVLVVLVSGEADREQLDARACLGVRAACRRGVVTGPFIVPVRAYPRAVMCSPVFVFGPAHHAAHRLRETRLRGEPPWGRPALRRRFFDEARTRVGELLYRRRRGDRGG